MNWGFLVCLSLIALASVVQTALLVNLASESRQFFERMRLLDAELRQRLLPQLAKMDRLTDNMRELSDGALRIEAQISGTLETIRDSLGLVERLVMRPLVPVAAGLALFRGLRRGFGAFRRPSVPQLPIPGSEA
jgi:hypothetical protein